MNTGWGVPPSGRYAPNLRWHLPKTQNVVSQLPLVLNCCIMTSIVNIYGVTGLFRPMICKVKQQPIKPIKTIEIKYSTVQVFGSLMMSVAMVLYFVTQGWGWPGVFQY